MSVYYKLENHSQKILANSKLVFNQNLSLAKDNLIVFTEKEFARVIKEIGKDLFDWQVSELKISFNFIKKFQTHFGSVSFIQLKSVSALKSHYELLDKTDYTNARDLVGSFFATLDYKSVKSLTVSFLGVTESEFRGSVIGIEMGVYNFSIKNPLPKLTIDVHSRVDAKKIKASFLDAQYIAEGVNFGRLLVDTPSSAKTPGKYSDFIKKSFSKMKNVKVEIWNKARLEKEKMGLLLGVGSGSSEAPCMVHISYRPKSKKKPIALVGKGVTFDSGGYDIKTGGSMKLMKKDMGGSASVAGIAYYALSAQIDRPLDIYLALAENMIDAHAMRPGDILTARNGLKIEITNTDAEGRLVLGDALDVAITQKVKPEYVINLATLTGAIKSSLGSEIPGMFSNNDVLADKLLKYNSNFGESSWRMPLVPKMKGQLRSKVADMVNSADGWGGAVTAALFLEAFVGNTPWAHFDIYAWNDSPNGPFQHGGGNGQLVQSFAEFLKH